MERETGIEPATNSLEDRHGTVNTVYSVYGVSGVRHQDALFSVVCSPAPRSGAKVEQKKILRERCPAREFAV